MKIHAFGHACVGIETHLTPTPNLRILWDPFEPGSFQGAFAYPPIEFTPDLILLSHPHADHTHTTPFSNAHILPLFNTPYPPRNTLQAPLPSSPNTLPIHTLKTWHDAYEGTTRGGANWLSLLTLDNLRILHTGDLGELPPQSDLDAFLDHTPVDLLFVSCGGFYTLNNTEAAEFARRTRARIILPMHARTALGTLHNLSDTQAFCARFSSTWSAPSPTLHIPPDPNDPFFTSHRVISLPRLAC